MLNYQGVDPVSLYSVPKSRIGPVWTRRWGERCVGGPGGGRGHGRIGKVIAKDGKIQGMYMGVSIGDTPKWMVFGLQSFEWLVGKGLTLWLETFVVYLFNLGPLLAQD